MEMVQEINLYRVGLSLKRRGTSLARVQVAASFVLVAVLVWPGWMGWELWTLQRQLREVKLLLADTQQQLAMAEQQALLQDPELRGLDEAAMRRELTELHTRRSALTAFMPSEDVRYSRFLAAIARRQVPGLWLTRIELDGNGVGVKLEGQSTDPTLVPAFVARLGYEDVLAGVTFRGLHLFQNEGQQDATAHVSFVIATEPTSGAGL